MKSMAMEQLMKWITEEYHKQNSIFGIRKIMHYENVKKLPLFEEVLEAPFGLAAGPHTQLAQNIIAGYVAGARFFELKTVQVIDGPEMVACIPRPCILAKEEGYNCEWSTELRVEEALEEYIKAWIICKLLAREFDLGDPNGFVFNMSVGYTLEGIQSPKINHFIDSMMDAKKTSIFQSCIQWTLNHLDIFSRVDADYVLGISPKISQSITLSTLHGCPAEDIENIACYLLGHKHLHTFIKCNPTLLGYEDSRKILNHLGYSTITFDQHHFQEDMQWEDAVSMFERLMDYAKKMSLSFGVKLSNTLPVDVKNEELPAEEMYMSGPSLYPLTLHLTRKISEKFHGNLKISFSGGASIYNIKDLFEAGIWPVTMATNLLKPGGYERLYQIANQLKISEMPKINMVKLMEMDILWRQNPLYKKVARAPQPSSMAKKPPLFHYDKAPCQNTCPIGQDIPSYIHALEMGNPAKALSIILEDNPLPFITGNICPHTCTTICMRQYYESSVQIRQMKLLAANQGYESIIAENKAIPKISSCKIAIIGGGPAGLAAASFLSREGLDVTVFEKRGQLGGIIRHVIPSFRIDEISIEQDIRLCQRFGARFEVNHEINDLEELKAQGFTHFIVATGAWKAKSLPLGSDKVMDALHFLECTKKNQLPDHLGKQIIIIGGGNTAMDAAQMAKRLPGVENVQIIYRRTMKEMPAFQEEIQAVLADGIPIIEGHRPFRMENDHLICLDAQEQKVSFPANCIILAIGQEAESNLISVPGTYVIGDAKNGPATVVEAIAHAQMVAKAILKDLNVNCSEIKHTSSYEIVEKYLDRKGILSMMESEEMDHRCLGCSTVCQVCADVCPNRANIAVKLEDCNNTQVIHMDGMCNQCGNCIAFCPYEGSPYEDKFTLFWSEESFTRSKNDGFFYKSDQRILLRYEGRILQESLETIHGAELPSEVGQIIENIQKNYTYLLQF